MTDEQIVFVPADLSGITTYHTRMDCDRWPTRVLAHFKYTRQEAERRRKEPCAYCARIAPRPADGMSP